MVDAVVGVVVDAAVEGDVAAIVAVVEAAVGAVVEPVADSGVVVPVVDLAETVLTVVGASPERKSETQNWEYRLTSREPF